MEKNKIKLNNKGFILYEKLSEEKCEFGSVDDSYLKLNKGFADQGNYFKFTLIFGFYLLAMACNQPVTTAATKSILTSKYAGIYSYGVNAEKERVGSITVFPETDTTVLFYIDLNVGAPSYNMGSLYGRVVIKNDTGTFFTKYDYEDNGCKWKFVFTKDDITIKAIEGQADCGFGHAVFADGVFNTQSNKVVEYFENMEGKKVYFKETKPEDYYKE